MLLRRIRRGKLHEEEDISEILKIDGLEIGGDDWGLPGFQLGWLPLFGNYWPNPWTCHHMWQGDNGAATQVDSFYGAKKVSFAVPGRNPPPFLHRGRPSFVSPHTTSW